MTIPHFFVEGNTETKVLEKLKLIEPVVTKQEPGAERTLAHAQESDIQEVFAPLLAAAQFLGDDPVAA